MNAEELLLLGQYSYLLSSVPTVQQVTTLTASAASVSLPVPAGFNTLTVKWRVRAGDSNPGEQMWLTFNGDTGNNYLWQVLQGNNASAASTSSGAAVAKIQIATIAGNSATANYFSQGTFDVGGASDATFKTVQGTAAAFSSTTSSWTGVYSGQWLSTATIQSIGLAANGNLFLAGSRFTVIASL